MTADPGRDALLYWGDESPQPLIAGVQEFTVTIDGEGLEITNNDSAGWRTLIAKKGVRGVTIQVSGVLLDGALLLEDSLDDTQIQQALRFVRPNTGELAGTFHLNAYSESGPHDNVTTFEATFVSSGVVTATPAA